MTEVMYLISIALQYNILSTKNTKHEVFRGLASLTYTTATSKALQHNKYNHNSLYSNFSKSNLT